MNDKAYKFSTRDDTTFRVDATGSGVMVVEIELGEPEVEEGVPPMVLKKTWQEIYDAIAAGTPVFTSMITEEGAALWPVMQATVTEIVDLTSYHVEVLQSLGPLGFEASSPSDYPTHTDSL